MEGDERFRANAEGLLDGSVKLEGLDIDNNMRWTILKALAGVNAIDNARIDEELAKRDTTENREFAYGARASRATAKAKAWAWDQALHNGDLTNMQLEAVAAGFASTPREDLAKPYAAEYFNQVDWVWEHKTFHMAEALLEGLYPSYADPAELVRLGDQWLSEHADAPRALRRIIIENLTWASLYNSVVLPFAAIGWITPIWAALGMSVSSLLVVINALRLTRT